MRSSSCRDAWLFGCTGPHGVHGTNLDGARFSERSVSLLYYKQVIFETFDMPATHVPIVSSHSFGRITGTVMEFGDGISRTKPAYEGYALPHAAMRGGTAAIL